MLGLWLLQTTLDAIAIKGLLCMYAITVFVLLCVYYYYYMDVLLFLKFVLLLLWLTDFFHSNLSLVPWGVAYEEYNCTRHVMYPTRDMLVRKPCICKPARLLFKHIQFLNLLNSATCSHFLESCFICIHSTTYVESWPAEVNGFD